MRTKQRFRAEILEALPGLLGDEYDALYLLLCRVDRLAYKRGHYNGLVEGQSVASHHYFKRFLDTGTVDRPADYED